jgi:hypothetical protein
MRIKTVRLKKQFSRYYKPGRAGPANFSLFAKLRYIKGETGFSNHWGSDEKSSLWADFIFCYWQREC